MGKTKRKTIRFDEDIALQISELAAFLGQDKSTIVRMLCVYAIRQMQDEEGNWTIPETAARQDVT